MWISFAKSSICELIHKIRVDEVVIHSAQEFANLAELPFSQRLQNRIAILMTYDEFVMFSPAHPHYVLVVQLRIARNGRA